MDTKPASHYPTNIDGRRRVKQPYEIAFAQREAAENRRRDWKSNFLRAYSSNGNVTKSCRECDIPPQLFYKARKEDPDFAESFAVAHRAATDKALEAVWQIGVEGVREPIIYQGEIVGYHRTRDWKAAKFLLETFDPGTYSQRERIARMGQMQADELNRRRDEMLKGAEERIKMLSGNSSALPAEIIDADVEEDDDPDS